jgi:uncharacterized protein (TIGR00299 family) protein
MPETRHIHLDAVGGAAGDMFIAAMLDALPELRDRVLGDVAAVLPPELGTPCLREGLSGGLAVLRFGLADTHAHHGGHHHAGYRDLVNRIETATLSHGAAERAVAILCILGEAEARMHRVPLEQVHFHELADWDSLMDVVAAGSIAAALDGASWSVSDLPRGSGRVRTQHGILPVPAPATMEILRGFRWTDDGVPGERVTPTGAAILRHLVGDTEQAMIAGTLTATGMGAGTRDLPGMPNILRALVFDRIPRPDAETVAVLCFDIDDMTGEEIGVALDRLRAADGVLDISVGTRIGKKGRPLQDVRLLVRPEALVRIQDLCFHETSTLGLRWRLEARPSLPRRTQIVPTGEGDVRLKRATRPGGSETAKAESDDLLRVPGLARRRWLRAQAEHGGAGS